VDKKNIVKGKMIIQGYPRSLILSSIESVTAFVIEHRLLCKDSEI